MQATYLMLEDCLSISARISNEFAQMPYKCYNPALLLVVVVIMLYLLHLYYQVRYVVVRCCILLHFISVSVLNASD